MHLKFRCGYIIDVVMISGSICMDAKLCLDNQTTYSAVNSQGLYSNLKQITTCNDFDTPAYYRSPSFQTEVGKQIYKQASNLIKLLDFRGRGQKRVNIKSRNLQSFIIKNANMIKRRW